MSKDLAQAIRARGKQATWPGPKLSGKFKSYSLRQPSADIRASAASAYVDGPTRILPGVHELSFADVRLPGNTLYQAPEQQNRIAALAQQIDKSQSIEPLWVAHDGAGLYVAEGAHRARALQALGHDTFPARVMLPDPPTKAP